MPDMNQALTPICALALALVLAAAPVNAEWVKIGTSRTAVHYVDSATVRKDGNLRRVWAMQNMVEASEAGVRSIRALQEYDCALQRFRYVTVEAHTGPMAGGWVLARHEVQDGWSDRVSAIGKMVCRD